MMAMEQFEALGEVYPLDLLGRRGGPTKRRKAYVLIAIRCCHLLIIYMQAKGNER